MKQNNLSTGLITYFKWIVLSTILTISCNGVKESAVRTQNPNGRDDAWGFTGFGGGGAMFNPAVSPHNADYAYVACDMTGSYVTYDGGLSWRMFSLRAPVKYFVFDPVDPDVVYANSIALFKSSDRGHTWNLLYPGAAEIKGIVAKGDHAEDALITTDSTDRQVLAMAVDPDNSMKLHAAISVDNNVSYYMSDDQGRKWIRDKELENGVRNIFIDPSSPRDGRTLYFTGRNSITIRENGIWKINPGPLNVTKVNEFAGGFDKSRKRFIIYAISGKSYFNPQGDPSGIYYTDDGGKTWENRQNDLLRLQTQNSDPRNGDVLPQVLYIREWFMFRMRD